MKTHIITGIAIILLMATLCPFMAYSEDIQTIVASPGQTITYHSKGTPGSQATMEVSASIGVAVTNNHYSKGMNGISVPGGSHFSIIASPVDTLTISGSPTWASVLSYSIQGTIKNRVGTASMGNIPEGTYNIEIFGISNGSKSVTITVYATQSISVGGDGTFTVSISTAGLPASIYTVKQNGAEVAKIYLGVQPPVATPTPTPLPSPTITPTPKPSSTATPTPQPNSTITPTLAPGNTSPSPSISISPSSNPGQGFTIFGISVPGISILGSISTTVTPTPQPAESTPTPIVSIIPSHTGGNIGQAGPTLEAIAMTFIIAIGMAYLIKQRNKK